MAEIVWDQLDERFFDQGVDHGIFFERIGGQYVNGVPWNGLTNVTQSPSGAEPNKQWADNIVYANLLSAEEFAATIEAFMAPRAFDKYNGVGRMSGGLQVGQQSRGVFGFYWRTGRGTAENPELGFVHNFAYGCTASPSEKSSATKNDSPELATYSWSISTVPEAVPGFKPSAYAAIDETDPDVSLAALAAVLAIVYGDAVNDPRMPLPAELNTILGTGAQTATPVAPTFDGVDEITIPVVAGVEYTVDGAVVTGAVTITADTIVKARPASGYSFTGVFVSQWLFETP